MSAAAAGAAAIIAALGLVLAAAGARAQVPNASGLAGDARDARDLAARVAQAGGGTVRLQYPVRPGVCGGGGDGVTVFSASGAADDRVTVRWTNAGRDCEPGPARLTLTVEGGTPRALRVAVGGRWRPVTGSAAAGSVGEGTAAASVHDLGTVSGPVAAAYLLDVAPHIEGAAAERAVLGAAIADATVVWPGLLRLARNGQASDAARRAATFWAGQFACDAVRSRVRTPDRTDTAGREVRKQVVFALSQRAGDERVATLTRVARADRDPEVRCAALFWLGQPSGASEPARRAVDLYEEVLHGP